MQLILHVVAIWASALLVVIIPVMVLLASAILMVMLPVMMLLALAILVIMQWMLNCLMTYPLVELVPAVPTFIVSFLSLSRREVFSGQLTKCQPCVLRRTRAEHQ